MKFCCDQMKEVVEYVCETHADPYDCPDNLVDYTSKYDEYGIIVHDGGSTKQAISYCPWCGTKLPESKRDRWFNELEAMGIDPGDDKVPIHYRTDAWYRTPES